MHLRVATLVGWLWAATLIACPGDNPAKPDAPAVRTNLSRDHHDKLSSGEGQARARDEKRKHDFQKMSPAEREAKRKEIKARLDARLAELRSKHTNGAITIQEQRELARCEQILKRFNEPKPPRPPRKENEK
jgi:hypothetical protein